MPSLVESTIAAGSLSVTTQPVLVAGSITLRPWAGNDLPALVSAYAEPEIQRWHARSMSPDEASSWIAEAGDAWMSETAASWAVDVEGTLEGRMTLKLDLVDGVAEAAYWTRAAASGRGIASGALRRATTWAFEVGLHRVELEHSTRNPASCRVATKAGFSSEGTRRGSALHADGWHDMHVHGRISGETSLELGG
ncbi:GNAT family N-acetyltransferase [Brachybacterium sp. 107]|uniref:GNAT family N-acetyltransferase n=1 Tax=Brachybacterium sp. 107 TaxID=3457736 RepID=UPI00403465D3